MSQNSYSTPKTDAVAFRIGGKMETAPHRVEYRSEEVVPAERMRELECELAEVLKRAATAEARLVERPTPESGDGWNAALDAAASHLMKHAARNRDAHYYDAFGIAAASVTTLKRLDATHGDG